MKDGSQGSQRRVKRNQFTLKIVNLSLQTVMFSFRWRLHTMQQSVDLFTIY
jgi:hypothetical protein